MGEQESDGKAPEWLRRPWGDHEGGAQAATAGYVAVPRAFIRQYRRMGVTPLEALMAVFSAGEGSTPKGQRPTYRELAWLLKIHRASIYRSIRRLSAKGLALADAQRPDLRPMMGWAVRLHNEVVAPGRLEGDSAEPPDSPVGHNVSPTGDRDSHEGDTLSPVRESGNPNPLAAQGLAAPSERSRDLREERAAARAPLPDLPMGLRSALSRICATSGWRMAPEETAALLLRLGSEHPAADPAQVAQEFRAHARQPTPATLAGFFRAAAHRGGRGGEQDARASGTPPARAGEPGARRGASGVRAAVDQEDADALASNGAARRRARLAAAHQGAAERERTDGQGTGAESGGAG